jgi:hypothetical protein
MIPRNSTSSTKGATTAIATNDIAPPPNSSSNSCLSRSDIGNAARTPSSTSPLARNSAGETSSKGTVSSPISD